MTGTTSLLWNASLGVTFGGGSLGKMMSLTWEASTGRELLPMGNAF